MRGPPCLELPTGRNVNDSSIAMACPPNHFPVGPLAASEMTVSFRKPTRSINPSPASIICLMEPYLFRRCARVDRGTNRGNHESFCRMRLHRITIAIGFQISIGTNFVEGVSCKGSWGLADLA